MCLSTILLELLPGTPAKISASMESRAMFVSCVLSRIRYALQRSIFRETCSHPTLIPGRWEAAVSKINVCKVLNAVEKQLVARLAIYVDGLQGMDRDVFVMPYTRICTSN